MKFFQHIDLNGNELKGFSAEKLASAPSAYTGRIYFNTTDNKFYGYNGTAWVDLSAIGGGGGGASWQTATASTAGASSVDLSTDHYVEINGDANFNLSIIDTADIQTGIMHVVVVENTTAGQITITDGLGTVSNLGASVPLDAGEFLRLQVFKDNTGEIHVVGGVGE